MNKQKIHGLWKLIQFERGNHYRKPLLKLYTLVGQIHFAFECCKDKNTAITYCTSRYMRMKGLKTVADFNRIASIVADRFGYGGRKSNYLQELPEDIEVEFIEQPNIRKVNALAWRNYYRRVEERQRKEKEEKERIEKEKAHIEYLRNSVCAFCKTTENVKKRHSWQLNTTIKRNKEDFDLLDNLDRKIYSGMPPICNDCFKSARYLINRVKDIYESRLLINRINREITNARKNQDNRTNA